MIAIGAFCTSLLVCLALGGNILYALSAGLVIFVFYGKKQGYSWRALGKMIGAGVKTSGSVLLVFQLIGVLTAFWRACGALPLIICCAVDLIQPKILLLMTFLLNCGVSVLTGTAFGTAATMGTICVSVGVSMGMDPLLLGGAMLSGVYFGDRCSPVSTSALLVSELTGTDIYDNIRCMVKTGLVPFLLSCAVYLALGLSRGDGGAKADLWPLYGREMTLLPIMCLPAVLILVLAAFRVKVKRAMAASILASLLLCVILRHMDALTLLRTAVFGYTAADAAVGAMLNGGGDPLDAARVDDRDDLVGLFRHLPRNGAARPPLRAHHGAQRAHLTLYLHAFDGTARGACCLQPDADDHPDASALRAVAKGQRGVCHQP